MRTLMALQLLAVVAYLPFRTDACNSASAVPVINSVEFPTEILGDNTANTGKITFTDANAGVQFAHLTSVSCPTNFVCSSASYDLTETDPEVVNYNAATIPFKMQCSNPTANDVTLAYAWTLEDIEGNVSEPVDFSFVCIGTNKNPVPVITSLSFPSTVPGNGTSVSGTMTFSDGNAGVRYATLTSVSCPTGFTCPQGTSDLSTSNPNITTVYSGNIGFSMSCNNQAGYEGFFRYNWTLKDTQGNISAPWEFAFTCKVNTPTVVYVGPSRAGMLVGDIALDDVWGDEGPAQQRGTSQVWLGKD